MNLAVFCGRILVVVAILILIVVSPLVARGQGENDGFRVKLALSGNPSTLDPHATSETLAFQVVKSLYDTLLEPDSGGRLVPALAQRWEIAEDNLSITFFLRKDVEFHDGSGLDSADVVASIHRIQDADFASPNVGEFEVIEDIYAIDDFTVRMELSEPSAPLLYTLASGWSAILPGEAIDSGHNFATEPIGTGPFALSQWRADEEIVLDSTGRYSLGEVEADGVNFVILPEPSVQVQAILSGQVDILHIVRKEDIPVLEASRRVVIQTLDSALVLVIAMNTSRDILGNLTMRKAINHAINKEAALEVAYGGGTATGTFNDVTSPYYRDFTSLYPYDPQSASRLAAEAGYTKDRVLDLVLPRNYSPHVTAGELYQEMLRNVGIETRIRMVDWPTWISDVYGKADYDLTVIGHTGRLDPDGRFIGYGSGDMYVRWPNAELEALIDQGRSSISIPARTEIYAEVQRIFAENLPFVFVGSPQAPIALSSSLSGFIMTPYLDSFDFRKIRRN